MPDGAQEQFELIINGRPHSLQLDTRTSLLDALREALNLTGTKKGCANRVNHRMEGNMTKATPVQNKALVLEAFDTLFNKRDYEAAARFWSNTYIQHSAHIEPGREGLFNLVRSAPDSLRYEHQLMNISSSSLRATTSSFMGASQAMAGLPPGSPPMLSGWRMAALPNIGMSCKTKRQKPNPRAACRCSATISQSELATILRRGLRG
jgi:hypothetical protein